MSSKISVIVPTYRSTPEGLSRVIDSLDAQTMPAADFEVIFVDDGSGDDTAARLAEIAATRPNVRVIEIENSGWAGRPRNVGIEAADGEYVTFLDHDDSLFPDALRSAYDIGAQASADFVNPKEVTDRGWSWGWDVWTEDRVIERASMKPRDITPLIPHKLYRREFLLENNIRFPEGPRAFWEDFYFNVEVFVHAKRIAILASAPFYRWHRDTGANSSNMLHESVEEYWSKLGAVAQFMTDNVTDPQARRWLLINHYRWWVVDVFGPRMYQRDAAFVAASVPFMTAFLERWVPESVEEDLEPAQAATSALMHVADLDHLIQLSELERGAKAVAETRAVEWGAGGLAIRAEATWTHSDGEPILFRRDRGRVYRVVGEELSGVLSAEVLDVTDAITTGWGAVNLRSRGDRISWRVPTSSRVVLDSRDDGLLSARTIIEATIDPATMVFGRALADGIWDVGARFAMMGLLTHGSLRYNGPLLPGVSGGRFALAFATKKFGMALDVGLVGRSLLAASRFDFAVASALRAGLARTIHVPLKSVSLADGAAWPVLVQFDDSVPVNGAIIGTSGATELVVEARLKRGTHPWRILFGDRVSDELRPINVDGLGRIRFSASNG